MAKEVKEKETAVVKLITTQQFAMIFVNHIYSNWNIWDYIVLSHVSVQFIGMLK